MSAVTGIYFFPYSLTGSNLRVGKGPRTVLMKDCPLKLPEKSFKENDIFF